MGIFEDFTQFGANIPGGTPASAYQIGYSGGTSPWDKLTNNPIFNAYKSGPVNAYGVPLDANNNLGLYGQLENAKNLDTSQNGGVFGLVSEVLFGEKPPQLPASVAEGILGGSLGDEFGKAIKPLALPLAIGLALIVLSRGKL